ncbi:unnamed protein product [Timema podura]|uniref:Ig-like domain-containing protein n=1 Tax=Timema podura TaxID=61482 RepID=A0ABN7NK64_TIMPD|nr:unnamed protein product [Timema podura]
MAVVYQSTIAHEAGDGHLIERVDINSHNASMDSLFVFLSDNVPVSWIRRRDSHILTVDRYTFIADERFQAFLVEATDTWTLQIKYVQARDAGQYECQVSTEPKMSHFITLNVVACREDERASHDSSKEGRDWSNAMSITRIRDRLSYDKKARNTKHRLHKEYSSRRTTPCVGFFM